MARGRGDPPGQRQLRVGEMVRHVLADELARGDVHEPVLRETPVTVTEVRVSPDLRHATVFVTPLGGERMPEVLAALGRVRPYLRSRVARQMQTRYVPDLRFQADETFDRAQRLGDLLRENPPSSEMPPPEAE